jgi:uncharacterized protein with PIN domain
MVIDSSALVAILLREPEADTFTAAIATASKRLVGTPSLLETAMVMVGRLGAAWSTGLPEALGPRLCPLRRLKPIAPSKLFCVTARVGIPRG